MRPAHGRVFAGVCGAFGRATNTDPVLWRIVLAVLTFFGGVGLVVYLIGWLTLPSEGDTGAPVEAVLGRGRSSTPTVVTVIVACIVLLTLAAFLGGRAEPGVFIVLLLLGGGYLLLRERGKITGPPPAYPPTPGYPPAPGYPVTPPPPAGYYPPTSQGATMSSPPRRPRRWPRRRPVPRRGLRSRPTGRTARRRCRPRGTGPCQRRRPRSRPARGSAAW
ncbi:PspC domain-containing protein [Luedemannella flava]